MERLKGRRRDSYLLWHLYEYSDRGLHGKYIPTDRESSILARLINFSFPLYVYFYPLSLNPLRDFVILY